MGEGGNFFYGIHPQFVGKISFSKTLLLYNVSFMKGSDLMQKCTSGCYGLTEMDLDTMTDTEEMLITRDEDIDRAARSLKAMSHPLRLKILCTLGDREVSVQDIVENVGTSQSNISQHLAILRDKGILASRKDANRVYYRVGDARTLRLISMMRDVFCAAE